MDATESLLESLDPNFYPYAWYFVAVCRSAGIPLIVISARRDAALNKRVGGAVRSMHLVGQAIDVQVEGYRTDQIPFAWWERLGSFWEALGGRWGGRFDPPDLNHFDSGASFVSG